MKETEQLRAFRLRRAFASVCVGYIGRVLNLVVAFISVPLTLHYLDVERYGLWVTISSIIAYLNVTDLGLGLGLQNEVAKALAKDDHERVTALTSTTFAATLIVSILFGVLYVGIARMLPLGSWFHLAKAETETEFRIVLYITGIAVIGTMPARILINAQAAYQEAYKSGLWGIVASVGGFCALLAVIHYKGGMIALSIATIVFGNLFTLGNVIAFLYKHPQARPAMKRFEWQLLAPLFLLGSKFLIVSIYTLILWNIDNIVISTRLGPSAVVPYAVPFRLMWIALTALSAIPYALWPAYTEASARADWQWIESTHNGITKATVLSGAAIGAILVTWGNSFIVVWTGPKAVGNPSVLWGLALYLICAQWNTCNGTLLNSIGRPGTLIIGGLFDAGVKIGLAFLLIDRIGVSALAWASVFAALLVPSWYYVKQTHSITKGAIRLETVHPWVLATAIALTGIITGSLAQRILPGSWEPMPRVALGIAITGIVPGAIIWTLGLSTEIRVKITGFLQRRAY